MGTETPRTGLTSDEGDKMDAMRKKPEGWTSQDYHRHYVYLEAEHRIKTSDTVLEIGCGDGTGPAYMGPPIIAAKAKSYLGIDKKHYKNPPFKFVREDFWRMSLEKYDVIVAFYVIQYVKPVKFFKMVSHLLKPDGVAYFAECMNWQVNKKRLTPIELYETAERDLEKAFSNVEILGIKDGILVSDIKTGVFAIASN